MKMNEKQKYDDQVKYISIPLGSLVKVWSPKKPGQQSKTQRLWHGSYRVISQEDNDNYRLEHTETRNIIRRHISLIKIMDPQTKYHDKSSRNPLDVIKRINADLKDNFENDMIPEELDIVLYFTLPHKELKIGRITDIENEDMGQPAEVYTIHLFSTRNLGRGQQFKWYQQPLQSIYFVKNKIKYIPAYQGMKGKNIKPMTERIPRSQILYTAIELDIKGKIKQHDPKISQIIKTYTQIKKLRSNNQQDKTKSKRQKEKRSKGNKPQTQRRTEKTDSSQQPRRSERNKSKNRVDYRHPTRSQ